LLEDVRGLVISRAFAARPRRVEISPIETSESQVSAKSVPQAQAQVQDGVPDGKNKRKRR
jgi:hypothetical protein